MNENFLKGLVILTSLMGMMTLGIMAFVIITGTIPVKQLNMNVLKMYTWVFLLAFASSSYLIIPTVFRDTFWKNEKQIDNELEKLRKLNIELRRKIDKL